MAPPPAWLAERVRIHFDSVIFNLKIPTLPTSSGRWMDIIGFAFLVIAIAARDIKFAALALVCLFIARVLSAPSHDGILAWAKVIPGRRVAEYHALDRRVDRYETWTVPYSRLGVAIISDRGQWRIKVIGFPNAEAPELASTRDLSEARRLAREAGTWLRLPLRDVA